MVRGAGSECNLTGKEGDQGGAHVDDWYQRWKR